MTAAIETRGLAKRYGSHLAVRDVDLRVERGSVHGLIGPNGAGKTTVLRMLLDIIRPTRGVLTVLGDEPRRAPTELRRRIGYLPGEVRFAERETGRSLLRGLAQISGPVASGTIDALAERLDVNLHRRVRDLSKGNRQKLGLIQAFMHRPELLVLDEPTSGLDPLMQREFLMMVSEAREAGQTVLLSSHILSEIQQVADEVAVLAAGEVVAQGGVSSLRLRSVTRLRGVLAERNVLAVRQALASLPMLENLSVEPTTTGDLVKVTTTIRGELDPAIKALARFHVRDLNLEEPDLEESILDLYTHAETSA